MDEPLPILPLAHQRIYMNAERRFGAVKLKPISFTNDNIPTGSKVFSKFLFGDVKKKHLRSEDDNAQVCICKFYNEPSLGLLSQTNFGDKPRNTFKLFRIFLAPKIELFC